MTCAVFEPHPHLLLNPLVPLLLITASSLHDGQALLQQLAVCLSSLTLCFGCCSLIPTGLCFGPSCCLILQECPVPLSELLDLS